VGVVRKSRKFSEHPRIGRIARSSLRSTCRPAELLIFLFHPHSIHLRVSLLAVDIIRLCHLFDMWQSGQAYTYGSRVVAAAAGTGQQLRCCVAAPAAQPPPIPSIQRRVGQLLRDQSISRGGFLRSSVGDCGSRIEGASPSFATRSYQLLSVSAEKGELSVTFTIHGNSNRVCVFAMSLETVCFVAN